MDKKSLILENLSSFPVGKEEQHIISKVVQAEGNNALPYKIKVLEGYIVDGSYRYALLLQMNLTHTTVAESVLNYLKEYCLKYARENEYVREK